MIRIPWTLSELRESPDWYAESTILLGHRITVHLNRVSTSSNRSYLVNITEALSIPDRRSLVKLLIGVQARNQGACSYLANISGFTDSKLGSIRASLRSVYVTRDNVLLFGYLPMGSALTRAAIGYGQNEDVFEKVRDGLYQIELAVSSATSADLDLLRHYIKASLKRMEVL